jgi:hypothetical protein
MAPAQRAFAAQGPMRDRLSAKAALYMVHHVFLPPKLPQANDFDLELEDALINTVLKSLQEFKSLVDDHSVVDSARAMISNFRVLRDGSGAISEAKLTDALQNLSVGGMCI